jgi:26S proteasome regulatory subunit N8
LLPNLKVEEMVRNFSVKSNDYMYVIYVSSLIRSILSLHDLINNKIHLKETEQENAKKAKEREEELARRKQEAKKLEEEKKKPEAKDEAK